MKKYLILFAAVLAAFTSCKEKAEPLPDPATLTSFGIYAADNAFLSDDYVFENPSSKMNVYMPYVVTPEDLKSVVIRYELSNKEAGFFTIDGTAVASGSAVDLSSPADFVVIIKTVSTLYTVTVTIANAPYWTKIAESDVDMGSEMIMKINPEDNMPYMLGYVNGNGDAKKHYPILLGLDGTSIKAVGDTLAKVQSDNFGLDFAPDGTAFLGFNDKSAKLFTIIKVDSGKPTVLGTTTNPTANSVTSAPVSAIAANNVFAGCMANKAADGVAKRGLYMAHYDGSSLTAPVAVGDLDLNSIVYNSLTKTVNGVNYLMCLDFSNSKINVYKYAGNAWVNVAGGAITPLKNDGTTAITTAEYTYKSMDFDVDSKGNIYFFAYADFDVQEEGVKYPAVVKYDIATGKQTLVGGVIKMENALHAKARFAGMALDGNDIPYVVFANLFSYETTPARLIYIDNKTKTWSEPVTLSNSKISGIDIKFAEDGFGYVCLFNDDTDKYEIVSTNVDL